MAVSGYNVTVIVTFLMAVLLAGGIGRKRSFWIVCATVVLFVFFTGASASVVRAALMGVIFLTAKQIGRPGSTGIAVVFAAALMALLNPYIILWDAGFQLSFLSTTGLIYLSPIFARETEKIMLVVVNIEFF